jgi:hypothetical protein
VKRRSSLALLVLAEIGAACSYANGYDPARYANLPPAPSVDPEIEPLPPSPKRQLRDPRGGAVVKAEPVDASVSAIADAALAAPTPVAVPTVDAASDPTATCGSKADPCPMQRFMHGALATAHTSDTLTAAFTRLASMSPDPAWAWVAIATRGADLANAGDVAGAKAQCAVCHDAYREPYRAQYRSRKL